MLDVQCSTFISFSFDLTGCLRPAAALTPEIYKLRLVAIRPACGGCRYGYQLVTFICDMNVTNAEHYINNPPGSNRANLLSCQPQTANMILLFFWADYLKKFKLGLENKSGELSKNRCRICSTCTMSPAFRSREFSRCPNLKLAAK